MIRRPPGSTGTDPRFPSTTLFRFLRAAVFFTTRFLAAVLRAVLLRAAGLRAVVLRAAVFFLTAVFFLAAVFRAVVLRPVVLRAVVCRAVDFRAAVLRAVVLRRAVVFFSVFWTPFVPSFVARCSHTLVIAISSTTYQKTIATRT